MELFCKMASKSSISHKLCGCDKYSLAINYHLLQLNIVSGLTKVVHQNWNAECDSLLQSCNSCTYSGQQKELLEAAYLYQVVSAFLFLFSHCLTTFRGLSLTLMPTNSFFPHTIMLWNALPLCFHSNIIMCHT